METPDFEKLTADLVSRVGIALDKTTKAMEFYGANEAYRDCWKTHLSPLLKQLEAEKKKNEELMEALENLINDTSYLNDAGTTRYMWGRYSGDTLSPASAAAIEVLTKHTPKVKEDGE